MRPLSVSLGLVMLCLGWGRRGFGSQEVPLEGALTDCEKRLGDQAPRVRAEAARALRKMGREAIPAIEKALREEAASVRCAAARVLGRIGWRARAALPALRKALQDKDPAVSAAAALAVARIIEELTFSSPDPLPPLELQLQNDSAVTRANAARSLGEMGPRARPAVLALALA